MDNDIQERQVRPCLSTTPTAEALHGGRDGQFGLRQKAATQLQGRLARKFAQDLERTGISSMGYPIRLLRAVVPLPKPGQPGLPTDELVLSRSSDT